MEAFRKGWTTGKIAWWVAITFSVFFLGSLLLTQSAKRIYRPTSSNVSEVARLVRASQVRLLNN